MVGKFEHRSIDGGLMNWKNVGQYGCAWGTSLLLLLRMEEKEMLYSVQNLKHKAQLGYQQTDAECTTQRKQVEYHTTNMN